MPRKKSFRRSEAAKLRAEERAQRRVDVPLQWARDDDLERKKLFSLNV